MIRAEDMYRKVNSQISQDEIDNIANKLLKEIEDRIQGDYDYSGERPISYTEVVVCQIADIIANKAAKKVVTILRDYGYIVSERVVQVVTDVGLSDYTSIRVHYM